ncbi:HAMP domain-containing sensor histidine kinase [Draconibacterium sp. IB214405]|uniref:sensor histidine kinase n=1 Tax=Draconibacterium sp. IB214405 TaxID=3097352 RepID=UPI002A1106F0|nr:HAMP domain-containing sensor histidine kinase [Draconibacterium sp. IB214405]MDX8340768.1 HAMP domain-containing sensor histidine kinase [Draconibacterium sp. IB214405]
MKLLTKISLNFLSISLFIFLSGLIVFYFVLRQQVNQNINVELQKRQTSIQNELKSAHSTTTAPTDFEKKVEITPLSPNLNPVEGYSDTLILDKTTGAYTAYRQLQFVSEVNGQKFLVKIFKSHAETDNLMVRIILSMTLLVVALIIGLLVLNRHISQKTLKSFYDTINKIKKYDLNTHEDFQLKETDVKEFNDLNKVLISMTERIKNDYYNLKEYTENASHELQTPIAVIISKMELLLQSDCMQEKELKTISDAYEASTRLSRLTNTLLLLSKIGNRQFPEVAKIDLTAIINTQLSFLEDVIDSKNITIESPDKSNFVEMNPYLADILIANLLKNAIRHNNKSGFISITTSEKQITIANSGEKIQGSANDIFKRFYKSSSSDSSVGLGLAIVQKICEVSGFKALYSYEKNLHNFSIIFHPETNNSEA